MCYMSIFLFDVGSTHGHGPNGLGLGHGLGHGHGPNGLGLGHGLGHGHGPNGLSLGHGPGHGHGPGIYLGFCFVLILCSANVD